VPGTVLLSKKGGRAKKKKQALSGGKGLRRRRVLRGSPSFPRVIVRRGEGGSSKETEQRGFGLPEGVKEMVTLNKKNLKGKSPGPYLYFTGARKKKG